LVKVICDTSFLMILASKKIKNISSLGIEIGSLEFVVPDLVIEELTKISKTSDKKKVLHLTH
jgi:rRNA-processing protein FCF1